MLLKGDRYIYLLMFNSSFFVIKLQDQTIFYPKIYAVVHGYENVLDITQNIEFIEKFEPEKI